MILLPLWEITNNTFDFYNLSDTFLIHPRTQHRHKPCSTRLSMGPKVQEPPSNHIHSHIKISRTSGIEKKKTVKETLKSNFLKKTKINSTYCVKTHNSYLLSKFIHKRLKISNVLLPWNWQLILTQRSLMSSQQNLFSRSLFFFFFFFRSLPFYFFVKLKYNNFQLKFFYT